MGRHGDDTLAHRVPLSLQWRLQSWVWSRLLRGSRGSQANLEGGSEVGRLSRGAIGKDSSSPGTFC